jgi:plastocyanin
MRSLIPVRLFAALVVLSLAVLLAAGCNDDGGGGKTPATGQTPADQTPAAAQTPAGQTPAAGQTPSGGATAEIKMIAGTKFDKSELRVPANTDVEITADNTSGFHALAVFESEADADSGADPVAEADACSAPCQQKITVNLAAGEHYFRCQIHNSMNGAVIAE